VKIWFQNRRTKWKKLENISNAEAAEHKIGGDRYRETAQSSKPPTSTPVPASCSSYGGDKLASRTPSNAAPGNGETRSGSPTGSAAELLLRCPSSFGPIDMKNRTQTSPDVDLLSSSAVDDATKTACSKFSPHNKRFCDVMAFSRDVTMYDKEESPDWGHVVRSTWQGTWHS